MSILSTVACPVRPTYHATEFLTPGQQGGTKMTRILALGETRGRAAILVSLQPELESSHNSLLNWGRERLAPDGVMNTPACMSLAS